MRVYAIHIIKKKTMYSIDRTDEFCCESKPIAWWIMIVRWWNDGKGAWPFLSSFFSPLRLLLALCAICWPLSFYFLTSTCINLENYAHTPLGFDIMLPPPSHISVGYFEPFVRNAILGVFVLVLRRKHTLFVLGILFFFSSFFFIYFTKIKWSGFQWINLKYWLMWIVRMKCVMQIIVNLFYEDNYAFASTILKFVQVSAFYLANCLRRDVY